MSMLVAPRLLINRCILMRRAWKNLSNKRQMSKGQKPPPKDTSGAATKSPAAKCKDASGKKPPPPPVDHCKKIRDKDLKKLSGGTKCKPKKVSKCPPPERVRPMTCEELILMREGKLPKKKVALTDIQGGGPICPCPPRKRIKLPCVQTELWKKISLFFAVPVVALLSLFVIVLHEKEERVEFVNYPHMYKRTKPFHFRDGKRALHHHPYYNALPHYGYEDEMDEGEMGKTPETEAEKKERYKSFKKLLKEWEKMNKKREAEKKKNKVALDKERAKEQRAIEKAEKAEAQAQAKEMKRQEYEEKRERKREEAEDRKAAKAAAQQQHPANYED